MATRSFHAFHTQAHLHQTKPKDKLPGTNERKPAKENSQPKANALSTPKAPKHSTQAHTSLPQPYAWAHTHTRTCTHISTAMPSPSASASNDAGEHGRTRARRPGPYAPNPVHGAGGRTSAISAGFLTHQMIRFLLAQITEPLYTNRSG